MLRLIPRTICRMFGIRYSKIILRYPFFVTLFIFLAPRPGGKWSCLPILPQNSFKNYLSDSAVYSQSFYPPVSFLPGILLSCLEKIRPLFERSSVASLRLSRLFRELFRSFFRFSENCLFFLRFFEKIRPFPPNDIFHLLRLFHFPGNDFQRTIFSENNLFYRCHQFSENDLPHDFQISWERSSENDFPSSSLYTRMIFRNDSPRTIFSIVVVDSGVLFLCLRLVSCVQNNNNNNKQVPCLLGSCQSFVLALPSTPANSDAVNLCRT